MTTSSETTTTEGALNEQEQVVIHTSRSWLIGLPNQNVRSSFQSFVSHLVVFSDQFRKEKYAHYFFIMADPIEELFQFIVSPQPPEDVLVATLSGSLKTSLNLLTARKNGKYKNAEFMQLAGRVNDSLQTFITSLQDAIRRKAELTEKRKSAENLQTEEKSTENKEKRRNSNRRQTYIETDSGIKNKINQLRNAPSKPTVLSKFRSGLFNTPLVMMLGIVFCGLAFGGLACSEWYGVERVLWAWVGPFTVLGIGLILLARGYYLSHLRNPTYDETTWKKKFSRNK